MLAKLSNLRFNTVVGKKVLMAVTGLAMCLFLVGHLVGNLQLFLNNNQFNAYAQFLTGNLGPVVIAMELGLLGIFLIHIVDALTLLKQNYAARPVGYHTKTWARKKSKKSKKSWASTTMMWSGIGILVFVPLHVWHMKYGGHLGSAPDGVKHDPGIVTGGVGSSGIVTDSTTAVPAQELHDLQYHVVKELGNPIVGLLYVAFMVLLALHLYHAVSSACTTLGLNHPRYQKGIMWFGNIFTFVIAGGFLSIPLAVLAGLIHLPK